MGKVETIFWIAAGLLGLIWFIGWNLEWGPWVHALLITSFLLGGFDLIDKKRQAARRQKPR